jgi:asparagine synthase (glutamine-hydrolysing)
MCGIAGVYRRDGAAAEREDADRMARAMPHRGPDGHGAVAEGPVALGHVRLAIRDLTGAAAQPMRAPGGEGVLVYNGEVYNDAGLRAALVREGVEFRGTGDAEVVLHALARWGAERALPRFDGMFALAWWDAKERALWLARDRFGIKPLHVVVTPERVAFASEIRGLRALPGVARRHDPLEVVRRLFPMTVDEIRPPFEGVENVLAGEVWRLRGAQIERRTWFDAADLVDPARILAARREPPEAQEERVRGVVERAVRAHLASDVPVAAFTSGGVDSNLVAAIARETRPDLTAYTADMCHPESEAPDAEDLARHLGMPIRRVRADREAFLRAWADSIEAMEHPTPSPSVACALLVARAARAEGITVALTGEGADELFGGYDFFHETHRRWRRATRWWERVRPGVRGLRRQLREAPFRYQVARTLRGDHRRAAVALAPVEESRPHLLMERFASIGPPQDRAFLANCVDALHRHLSWILLRHDRTCMAASLESRVPFLCAEVADTALNLPVRAKLRGTTGKWILKRVAARRLPRRHVFARKRGYPVPSDHHAGTAGLLRGGMVPEVFRWTRAVEEDLLRRIDADPYMRQQVVSIEIWARIFVRGDRAAEVTERLLALAGGPSVDPAPGRRPRARTGP